MQESEGIDLVTSKEVAKEIKGLISVEILKQLPGKSILKMTHLINSEF